jgi:hypothetical protein
LPDLDAADGREPLMNATTETIRSRPRKGLAQDLPYFRLHRPTVACGAHAQQGA